MQHYALFYHLVDDYLTRRAQYRAEHLRLAREAHARGDLVLGGALADPVDRALLVFRVSAPDVVERFARADPYVVHGLVTRWEVRPWNVVIGEGAAPVGTTLDAETDARVQRHADLWTTDLARYAMVESDEPGFEPAVSWWLLDLVTNSTPLIEEDAAVMTEIGRRLREAGVRVMSRREADARIADRRQRRMQLREHAGRVETREDFVAFVRATHAYLTAPDNRPEDMTLEKFLGGLAASCLESTGAADSASSTSWKQFGELLLDGIAYWRPGEFTPERARKRRR